MMKVAPKKITVASARGSAFRDVKKKNSAPKPHAMRPRWASGRRLRKATRPPVRGTQGRSRATIIQPRTATTWTTETSAPTIHLAAPSMSERNPIPASMLAMPARLRSSPSGRVASLPVVGLPGSGTMGCRPPYLSLRSIGPMSRLPKTWTWKWGTS